MILLYLYHDIIILSRGVWLCVAGIYWVVAGIYCVCSRDILCV